MRPLLPCSQTSPPPPPCTHAPALLRLSSHRCPHRHPRRLSTPCPAPLSPTGPSVPSFLVATLLVCAASPNRPRLPAVASRLASAHPAAAPTLQRTVLEAAASPAPDSAPGGPIDAEGIAAAAEDLVRATCTACEAGATGGAREEGEREGEVLDRGDPARVAALSGAIGAPAANVLSAAVHLAAEAHAARRGGARRHGVAAGFLSPLTGSAAATARLSSPAGLRAFSAMRRAALAVDDACGGPGQGLLEKVRRSRPGALGEGEARRDLFPCRTASSTSVTLTTHPPLPCTALTAASGADRPTTRLRRTLWR